MRKTKIICTLGPSTDQEGVLRELVANGMNVARFNFSHGSHEEHLGRFEKLKAIREELGKPVAALLDTKGPEIRLKDFKNGTEMLEAGQTFTLTTRDVEGTKEICSITYKDLPQDVAPGGTIMLDDGLIKLQIQTVNDTDIVCTVLNNGKIKNKKGVNVPGVHLSMPYMSQRDKDDIIFGIEQGFDFIAASFVRTAQDVYEIRNLLNEYDSNIRIIAKIENMEGVQNIDEIIRVSDGIMVARGDLGVEIPFEEVPLVQKLLIKKCIEKGKPVITATQMLNSMIENPRPTRAEVNDVANAIFDYTDAVMLSAESASGEYPEESVTMQQKISAKMETLLNYEQLAEFAFNSSSRNVSAAIANSVADTALLLKAKLIVCFSETGATSRRISRARPICPVIEVSNNVNACYNGVLNWGVYPKLVKKVPQFIEEMEVLAIHLARIHNIPAGSTIIITGGTPVGAGKTNFMKVITLDDNVDEVDL